MARTGTALTSVLNPTTIRNPSLLILCRSVHSRVSGSKRNVTILGEPLVFRNGRKAQNRFLKAALSEKLASWDPINVSKRGIPTDSLVNIYEKWGHGKYGIILTGNVGVDPSHLESAGNMVFCKENDSPELRAIVSKIAKAMKYDGALAVAQITHAGRQTPAAVNANPYSCSDIQVKAKGPFMSFGRPIPLTEEQIKTEVVDRFVYTAKFAHEQGFDGIELHGAHGYLLSSFLSPLTNNRTDKYGGPAVNRMRVVREIFEGIRQEIDQSTGFLVGIKMNSAEFQDYGLGIDDAKAIAGMMEKTGFDFVELSGGTVERPAFHHLRESTRKREAYFFEFAEQLRPCFEKTIVYLTGGFRTARGMVNAVLEKATDGVGLGRPTSAEPDLPAKILSGECLGAPDTKLGEDDFMLTLTACQTQMWQMGKRPLSQLKSVCDDIADLSNPEEADNFKKAAAAYYVQMQKAAEKNEAISGVLQYQNIAS